MEVEKIRTLDYGFIILGIVWLAMMDWQHMTVSKAGGALITVIAIVGIIYKIWLTNKRK